MYPTDLTVSAVIVKDGRFLFVEERVKGQAVLNQPGGHIETGESPEQALIREVREESACDVACGELQLEEITRPTDTYTGDHTVDAAYLQLDLAWNRWRFIGGVRHEDSQLEVVTVNWLVAAPAPLPYCRG